LLAIPTVAAAGLSPQLTNEPQQNAEKSRDYSKEIKIKS
jgi:hypothetical protein